MTVQETTKLSIFLCNHPGIPIYTFIDPGYTYSTDEGREYEMGKCNTWEIAKILDTEHGYHFYSDDTDCMESAISDVHGFDYLDRIPHDEALVEEYNRLDWKKAVLLRIDDYD